MKKIKSYLIALLMGIAVLCVSAVTVNAASAGTYDIVCNPDVASKTESTNCYVLAKVTGGNVFAINGVITKLEDLVITGASSDAGSNGVYGVGKVFGERLKHNQSSATKDKAGTSIVCANSNGNNGCMAWISKDGVPSIEESSDSKSPFSNDANLGPKYTGYTNFGYFTVKIEDNASDKACGEICMKFIHYGAATITDASKGTDPKEYCAEVKKKIVNTSTSTTTTGNFASYAVLAAGAFIAISAIAIAKKHNKFYRV